MAIDRKPFDKDYNVLLTLVSPSWNVLGIIEHRPFDKEFKRATIYEPNGIIPTRYMIVTSREEFMDIIKFIDGYPLKRYAYFIEPFPINQYFAKYSTRITPSPLADYE